MLGSLDVLDPHVAFFEIFSLNKNLLGRLLFENEDFVGIGVDVATADGEGHDHSRGR